MTHGLRQSDRNILGEPIVVPKASGILAGRLRALILSGEMNPGASLPPERRLIAESGLSRASVREALRMLEVEGLITTRLGRTGGAIVSLPGRSSVARSVNSFVRSHSIRMDMLLDCRRAIEPYLVGLAASRRTEGELRLLCDLHERFAGCRDNTASYKRLNLDWHLLIARASRNEVLVALMEAISQPIFDAADYHEVMTPDVRGETVRAHAAILDAIAKRDAARASIRMGRHLDAYAAIARKDGMRRKRSRPD